MTATRTGPRAVVDVAAAVAGVCCCRRSDLDRAAGSATLGASTRVGASTSFGCPTTLATSATLTMSATLADRMTLTRAGPPTRGRRPSRRPPSPARARPPPLGRSWAQPHPRQRQCRGNPRSHGVFGVVGIPRWCRIPAKSTAPNRHSARSRPRRAHLARAVRCGIGLRRRGCAADEGGRTDARGDDPGAKPQLMAVEPVPAANEFVTMIPRSLILDQMTLKSYARSDRRIGKRDICCHN